MVKHDKVSTRILLLLNSIRYVQCTISVINACFSAIHLIVFKAVLKIQSF